MLVLLSTESVCGRMVLSVGGEVLPDKESIDTEARGALDLGGKQSLGLGTHAVSFQDSVGSYWCQRT